MSAVHTNEAGALRRLPLKEALQAYRGRRAVFVMHAGSANHGCEAIATSLLQMWEEVQESASSAGDEALTPILVTNSVEEDLRYSVGERAREGRLVLIEERHMDRHPVWHVLYYLWRMVTKDRESFLRFRFRPLFRFLDRQQISPEESIIFSIGGDNYCYPEMVPDLILAHRMFRRMGFETVLLGCSVEPESVSAKENDAQRALFEDISAYEKVIAREPVSGEGLLAAGLSADRLLLSPDPAFSLAPKICDLPKALIPRRTIGINISPMVQENEAAAGMTMESVRALVKHILETSNAQIALIPHVVWPGSDDRAPLTELFESFRDTGRVCLLEDRSAPQLKYIISQCSLFVGARTHATIAAYSSGVPTLVLGYSVKSIGIAADLFAGTEIAGICDNAGMPAPFVLPVQTLQSPKALTDAYDLLLRHADAVQRVLQRGTG